MAKPVLDIKKVFHVELKIAAPFPNISLNTLDVIKVNKVDAEVVEVEGIEGSMSGGATDVNEGGRNRRSGSGRSCD